jgi:hypothetical protein
MSSLLVFNRVYRLEMKLVMLKFRPALLTIAPLAFSLVSSPPSPPSSVNSILYTCIQCVKGGVPLTLALLNLLKGKV